MKMHLNLIIAVALPVFASFTSEAQTCATKTQESLSVHPVHTTGGLLLDAGGTRRVIARLGMEGTHTLRVHLANLQEYATEIVLVAPDGSTRWEQTVASKPAFAKMLDLRSLTVEPGTYVLRIQAGAAHLSQELIAGTKGVRLGPVRYQAASNVPTTMAGK
ncbi:MAG: hypothetical protein ACKVU2_08865 [Saprospiraceae bacterium]